MGDMMLMLFMTCCLILEILNLCSSCPMFSMIMWRLEFQILGLMTPISLLKTCYLIQEAMMFNINRCMMLVALEMS